MRKILPLLLLVCSFRVLGQTPYLVKDINTTVTAVNGLRSSNPSEFAAFGSRIYFAATTPDAGTELWSTDGSSGGTAMVADIIAGSGSSNPGGFFAVNGTLLFNARDVDHGIELWATDGTAAGTHRLLDINPGPSSSQPGPKVLFNNRMLFGADDGTNGRELWISDGTAAGTHMLKDLAPGSDSSNPGSFRPFNGVIYFSAADALWKTDGTDAGTVQVAPIPARNLVVAGSQLFFEGWTANTGWELWVSDGTGAGTRMVTEIRPGAQSAFVSNFAFESGVALGNRLLFLASDGVHGREMWISDGTAAGTQMVRDFIPGSAGMWDGFSAYLTPLGNRAFFVAIDAAHGMELWVTDGTDAGTQLFADLVPGPGSSSPFALTLSGNRIFFAAAPNALTGNSLFVTDGTAAGTVRLGAAQSLGFGVNQGVTLWPVGGKVYFAGMTPLTGREPWVTDGTEAGTHAIANLVADDAPSSNPSSLTAAGNFLFFTASDGTNFSLWRSDGTDSGTFRLGSIAEPPSAVGPFVFFTQGGASGTGTLMMSDGTAEGTVPAAGFLSRFGSSKVPTLFPFGDTLFAAVNDQGPYDTSLWVTKAALNVPAVRLGGTDPTDVIDFGGRWAFYNEVSTYRFGLWTTDGTPAGTSAFLPDLNNESTSPGPLVNAAGTLYFVNTARDEKPKLWKSDGSFDGTVVVTEVPPAISEMKAVGRRLFYITSDNALWTSDGTPSGTIQLVKTKFEIGNFGNNLRTAGNRIVFAQYTSSTGSSEIWSSDGTVSGTQLLLKTPQAVSLTSIDGTIYFANRDDLHGNEVWTTDGTPDGTKLLYDINPGPHGSDPGGFTKSGSLLYFSAYTDTTGRELWAVPMTTPLLSIADTHAAEGNAGTTTKAHFTVSLAPPSTETVTVDYATSDGTATAGQDYDTAAGTLTFAPGETAKTIDVVVRGDDVPENNETFFVTLRNAAGAKLLKGEATGIIDDDDQLADLSVAPHLTSSSFSIYDAATVTNNGPRAATEGLVTVTYTPAYPRNSCTPCPVLQIPTGTSTLVGGDSFPPSTQVWLGATVSARQRDPQPANNSATWTISANRILAMDRAWLTAGSTATLTLVTARPAPFVSSSDPSVASLSEGTTANGATTFTVTGLKPGTATMTLQGLNETLDVIVTAPGTTPRWPGGISVDNNDFTTRFDYPFHATITPSGTAPLTGAKATGTVVFTAGGQEIARVPVTAGKSVVPFYAPAVGSIQYQISYSGDAAFLPQTFTRTLFVSPGTATLLASLQPTATPGSWTLTVVANGSPMAAPSGTLSIASGTTQLASVALAPAGGGTSVATTTLAGLSPSTTLTINYPGDAHYVAGSQQIRVSTERHRTIHH